MGPLQGFEGHLWIAHAHAGGSWIRGTTAAGEGEIVGFDDAVIAQDHRGLDAVFQLADVSRKVMGPEALEGAVGEAPDRTLVAAGVP